MAVEDSNGPIAWKGKNYKSVLEDYPYADDGMLIWNSLHQWCSDYLKVGFRQLHLQQLYVSAHSMKQTYAQPCSP